MGCCGQRTRGSSLFVVMSVRAWSPSEAQMWFIRRDRHQSSRSILGITSEVTNDANCHTISCHCVSYRRPYSDNRHHGTVVACPGPDMSAMRTRHPSLFSSQPPYDDRPSSDVTATRTTARTCVLYSRYYVFETVLPPGTIILRKWTS